MGVIAQLNTALTGRYAVECEIGAGGMATVYLARDLRHDRPVAVKVLNPELGALLGVERFLSEIRVTANLQHPNLLPLFDSGEAEGRLFYVMPFVEGESLRARLARETQLPVDHAVSIATAVADALDYAHRHGVIHRDLKPENILLHEGRPLVADFGIALAVSNAGGSRITQTGLSLGTPQYMSPEQATGDRTVDGRSDIYSLAAVLYEMLTGEPPHTGATSQAIIARVLTDKPRRVRATRESVPAHVDAAIDRALSKMPADRFTTARLFADALSRPSIGVTETEMEASRAPRGKGAYRRAAPILWPAAFVVAALFAVRGAILLRTREPLPVIRLTLPLSPNEIVWSFTRANPLAISPDGKVVAYAGGVVGGTQRLNVRSLDQTRIRELMGTEGASDPVFSPDGRSLAFVTGRRLLQIPVDGGSVTTIAELPSDTYGMDWGANDLIAVAVGGRITTTRPTNGTLRIIAFDSSGQANYRWPRVSPDGRWVLFTRDRGGASDARILAVPTGGGHPSALNLPGASALGFIDTQLIYASASGALMAIPFDARTGDTTGVAVQLGDSATHGPADLIKAALSRSGSLFFETGGAARQIVARDFQGNSRPVLSQARPYSFPRFSPNGSRLAVSIEGTSETQVSVYDFGSRTLTRLTTTGTANWRPEWTPDGKRVIFDSDQGGSRSLWWQPVDGSASAERLLNGAGIDNIWEGVIARDGRTLAYRTGTVGESTIWIRRLGDSTARRISEPHITEWSVRFSPDGRWIVFSSNKGGSRHIYAQPVDGPGVRVQVSDEEGASSPVWSPDGSRIYYVVGERLVAATVSIGTSLRVIDRKTVVDGGYYFTEGHASFDVFPNGKELLLIKSAGGDAELMVAYNWRAVVLARVTAAAAATKH